MTARERSYQRYLSAGAVRNYPTLDDFLSTRSVLGINSIDYQGCHLDLLVEDNSSPTTVVYFHAAVSDEKATVPLFNGRNLNAAVKANAIHISDPILERGLPLGWYVGDAEHNLQSDLIAVISKSLESLSNHQNLVLFGPSGGGFAALYYAAQFENSLAIPVNPQTSVLRYFESTVNTFLETCWPNLSREELPFCYDVAPLYTGSLTNSILYLQNLGDRSHVRNQLIPFLEEANVQDERFMLHLSEWGRGHRAAGTSVLIPLLKNIVDCQGDWEQIHAGLKLSHVRSPEQIESLSTKYIFKLIREEKK